MLKDEEIRQKYLFLKKGLNDFETEWIMFDCIHKVRKKSKKTIVILWTIVTIECQKLISHSITRWLLIINNNNSSIYKAPKFDMSL